ncbi:strawberry notch C-terminal domain-containing protein [Flavivirga rizhaonensis]|uniref:Helicase n=1 Tax=Flavivirga rizhaonensis TaxID=2559571 RepID=A0A4S1DZE1_9FLAO|nr:strawberry notch C-terminal domain-containing protein [Flavivirga rizhaonensis]TGV03590.1 helicase [Flavivirga rizhaonensis]
MTDTVIEIEEDEFKQSAEEVAKLAEQETALVPYIPKSKAPYVMDTLIPRNMAFEVQKSLNRIVKEKGNIDNYVRNALKYESTKKLWKGLGAEQVDAVGLYLKQFENEQGLIIADQTGIGKGRQAAAVIRHAVMQGYLPVFFTKKPDLFTDMYRDLKAIGFSNINPFIVNTDTDAKIKDANGHVVFSPMSSKAQFELLVNEVAYSTESRESIEWHKKIGKKLPDPEKVPFIKIPETLDHLPIGYDMIFCTYSQIQSAHPYKRRWLEDITANGMEGSKRYKKVIFILDESHMAGGYNSIIGKWMREVLPQTKACCFLSATFAKYPEVMPFYAKKTAIAETGLKDDHFVRAMISGGLALQEIVASNLSESGQLIRRQRSNEGIKVDYIVLGQEPQRSKNRESVNRIIALMNEVVQFEQEFITPILKDVHHEAKSQGERVKQKPRGLGVKQSPYFSRVFNIVDQMLFALKVKEVAEHTIKLLKEDKKVVIAFKSTMGAFLKEMNLVSGDIVPNDETDFVRTLVRGLDSLFYYSHTAIDGSKTRERVLLHELPQNGIDIYEDIKKKMLMESTGLNISPIDELIHLIEQSRKPKHLGGHKDNYFKVAEVTGRNQRLRFEDDETVVQAFRSNAERSFRLFNNGDYDVLLINQSGSTGSSAHASKDFKDQRQRAMIVHQFELDINTEVQKRGRINRTGQMVLPEYYYITSDIPMEKRLMTMLKAKLKSLDANTTGSQKTNDDTLKSADFLNKYGDVVAWSWIDENPEMLETLGYPSYHKNWDGDRDRNESKEGTIRQLTGRAGLLKVEDQDALYNELLERYDAQIKLEKQQGTYDLETEFLPLDAEIKKRFLFQKGQGGVTPFGKDTVRDVTVINNLKRPFTKQEIDARLQDVLGGEKPVEVRNRLEDQISEAYPKLIEQRKAKRMETIEKLKKDRDGLPERGSGETEKENEKITSDWTKLEELINEKVSQTATYIAGLENINSTILRYINFWHIGDVVKVPFIGTSLEASWGIFIGVSIGKSKNPYTLSNISLKFAVTDSRKVITYSLQPAEQSFISLIFTESKEVKVEDVQMVNLEWNALIKKASSKRERRHILTENIVSASNQIGTENKLIKYNTKDGTIKSGILMSRSYGKDGENSAVLPISEAYTIIDKLQVDDQFDDHKLQFRIKRISENYFQVFLVKKELYGAIIDESLRRFLKHDEGQSPDELPNFVQNAGDMTGALHTDNLQLFLNRLDAFGVQFLGTARELEDWEVENQDDWKAKTKQQKGTFKYQLGRVYGQGSNPTTGFVSYDEPNDTYEFGVVIYNRALTDKEKYNYSLIPIFKNVEEPYQIWKEIIVQTELKNDFNKVVERSRKLPLHEAIETLGYFITNNPHEDGNSEFVFGTYTPQALGRVFYEDAIADITVIDELIAQLQIAKI